MEDIMAGRISVQEIRKNQAAAQSNRLRNVPDRSFVGANSAISFEELSASREPESLRSNKNYPM